MKSSSTCSCLIIALTSSSCDQGVEILLTRAVLHELEVMSHCRNSDPSMPARASLRHKMYVLCRPISRAASISALLVGKTFFSETTEGIRVLLASTKISVGLASRSNKLIMLGGTHSLLLQWCQRPYRSFSNVLVTSVWTRLQCLGKGG